MVDPTWIAAGAASFAALTGAIVATSGLRTLRQTRFDSRERGRPILAAKLERVDYVPGSQKLVIGNYGTGIARRIWVTFEPLLPDPPASDATTSVTPFLKRRYAKMIPVMVPGVELENVYFSGEDDGGGTWINREPLPAEVKVRICYVGPDGHDYKDVFPIDVNLLRSTTEAKSSSDPDALMKSSTKSLAKIANSLRAVELHTRAMLKPSQRPKSELPDISTVAGAFGLEIEEGGQEQEGEGDA